MKMKMKKTIFICRWKIKKHFLQGGGIKMDIENEYEGKKILVTGGAGCIGTNKLFFQTLRKFNQQTFRKSLTKNAAQAYAERNLYQQLFCKQKP
jgi:hypothetical protein